MRMAIWCDVVGIEQPSCFTQDKDEGCSADHMRVVFLPAHVFSLFFKRANDEGGAFVSISLFLQYLRS